MALAITSNTAKAAATTTDVLVKLAWSLRANHPCRFMPPVRSAVLRLS